ncbi:acetolactate decarboxylase [Pontibacter harenae]|uniref:acetolactate decarboxylase n=1 Tax=Pontibacter harenae TaxID=2894083 RepID=UPI001E3A30BE|nr:acetolactate decarboxylase [Pontibacter harenae]MCC9168296.1 acetolactate decarboxylase [Pontibacter harenae]
MQRFYTWLLLLLLVSACTEKEAEKTSTSTQASENDAIFYASLNQAIHLGQYNGVLTVKELKQHGSLGVGSTARLVEELVIIKGVAYGIPANGNARELPDSTKVAFAAIKNFEPDDQLSIDRRLTLKELEAYLDSVITKNTFAAIRVRGKFSSITYRTFNPQDKPFRPTDDVPEVVYNRSDIQGTMAGFFTPQSAEVLNSPVYHFHFVDQNRTTGGHVKDFVADQLDIEIDYANELNVRLPDPALLRHIDLNKSVSE